MRLDRLALVLLIAASGHLSAQQPTSPATPPPVNPPSATGAVIGHVLCADTHQPARMASVVLQPVVDLDSPAVGPDTRNSKSEPTTTVVGTLLDGSFTIPNVQPGDYYVIAEKLGYLSPLSVFSRDDLNHPSSQTKDLIAQLLTTVTVVPSRTTNTTVTLLRGASISGTVRFDDGGPYAAAAVSLMHKDKTGKWVPFRTHLIASMSFVDSTDDRGRFRMVGLPAGEYLLKSTVDIHDIQTTYIFRNSGSSGPKQGFTLDVYYGDAVRQRDAKTIKLGDGEQSEGNDIEVSLTKLHSVSGTLLDSVTGQTVNGGRVELHDVDDNEMIANTTVGGNDDAFHFLYVPEGEYTLKVTNPREVTREEVSNCPDAPSGGCIPATHTKETTVQAYANAQQPIAIHNDVTGVTVSIQPKPPVKPAQ
jgi:hypothetical protein